MRIQALAAGLAFVAAPACAQNTGMLPESLTSASSIASAAKTLQQAAQDKLLVRDLLGTQITGANGDTLGTVENFAVIPGGRIVAAIVSTGSGTMIAVPFTALKVANTGQQLQTTVPASELTGMSELQSLADSLTK